MSRKLLCPECNERLSCLAEHYHELYESIRGKSKGEFLCDGCGKPNPIHEGDICFASVLLPNKEHFQYENQKPEAWMNDYLIPEPEKINEQ